MYILLYIMLVYNNTRPLQSGARRARGGHHSEAAAAAAVGSQSVVVGAVDN